MASNDNDRDQGLAQECAEDVGKDINILPSTKPNPASANSSKSSKVEISSSRCDRDVDQDEYGWDSWDPMSSASKSFRNSMTYRIQDPGALLTGSGGERMDLIPCPFQKESFKPCFKGRHCPYKHGKYTPQMLKDHPKLATTAVDNVRDVILAGNLPKASLPADGFISLAWITTVINPSEFYLLSKESSWRCLCKSRGYEDSEDSGDADAYGGGFDGFDELWRNMQSHYSPGTGRSINSVSLEYSPGELVAVKVQLETGRGWYRALVLEDTLREISSDAAPTVPLKLLDFGMELVKSTLDVLPLHQKFCYVGPMAYKCRLYGISPLLGTWGKKTTEFFKQLVTGQLLLVEVKRTVDLDGPFGLFFKSPMLVSLYVKYEGSSTPVNVCQLMGDRGMGLQWNPFPFRPFATEVLDPREHEYAIDVNQNGQAENSETLEREQSRLRRYLERLKTKHDLN